MRFVLALLALGLGGCVSWRPALVVSLSAVDASRTLLPEDRSASRWDLRGEATLVLVPRSARPVLVREPPPRRPLRDAPPCLAAWLCAWERAARDEATAGFAPASEVSP
jgi:hypothetical protein